MCISLFLMLLVASAQGQQRISTEQYIDTYRDVAIKKMHEYGIPASITLAQGILESGSGNSRLAQKANNHFGIKCHKEWTGKTYYMDDDEKHECFRKYKHPEDSYRDHSLFLTQRGRYSFLFEIKITDYEAWAKGLKKAGYATNPKYPELLIRIVEKYNLSQYDNKNYQKTVEKPVRVSRKKEIASMTIDQFKKDERYPSGRQLFSNNGKKLLIAVKGDTFNNLAKEFGIYTWQLYKYNDLNKDYVLKVGDIIYLEKKKRKADKQHPGHEVKQGETIRSISQLYGVRESRIYKMNNLPDGIQVSAGKVLKLR
ncbi:MAG: glucosaminidase domain-containing protein [Bacteroidales bacterium]|nr:glucosaminidase domain-containing protein [Bacteroidales bacterium]